MIHNLDNSDKWQYLCIFHSNITTFDPTVYPTIEPTKEPASNPTTNPTSNPTSDPTDATYAPSLSPTVAPSNAPTQPPSEAPTPLCLNLNIKVNNTKGLFNKTAFQGSYVYVDTVLSGHPVFEVPQIPNDKRIKYVGTSPTGQWVIDAAGSEETLSYGPTDLQYPPYGPSSITYNWSHNIHTQITFHVLIQCVDSFAPSNAPTAAPVISPSIAPTNNPTLPPTQHPTSAPSNVPTPTIAPTIDPTVDPTIDPTINPSALPTFPATRYPATRNEYDSYFDITYSIQNLTADDVGKMTVTPTALTDFINFIETSYVTVSILKYSRDWFAVKIHDVNGIDDETFQKYSFGASNLTLNSQIVCDAIHCDALSEENIDTQQFENNVENDLQIYFNGTKNIRFFIISQSAVYQFYNESTRFDYILWGLLAFIVIFAILTFCGYIYNESANSRVDDSRYYSIFVFGLHCFDLMSDIILSVEIVTIFVSSQEDSMLLGIAAYGCIIFIVVPYIANVIIAANIKRLIGDNYAAKIYFERYSALFIGLVVLCGGSYPVLSLLSSRVFAKELFNSGLTRYELRELTSLKIYGTIILENIPQLICQILYYLFRL